MPTPDWPSLHERCPSLRFQDEDGEFLEQTPGRNDGRWVWVNAGRDYRRHTSFMESVAAGLNRDAAAKWLDETLEGTPCVFYDKKRDEWQCAEHKGYSDFEYLGEPAKTKDQALANGCTAVLDARDAAKQPA